MKPRIELPPAIANWRAEVHARRERMQVDGDPGSASAIDGNEVRIYGALDPYFGIDAWDLAPQIAAMETDEITVRIDSPGGYVTDGILLYNVLADHEARVTVHVDAMAASAASFLAMAGDRIVMNRASKMMIHAAWGVAAGTAEELRATADVLDDSTRQIAEIYKARAGGRIDTWMNRLASDTYIPAAQAVEWGLADEMVDLKRKPDSEARAAIAAAVVDIRASSEGADSETEADGPEVEVADAENSPAETAPEDDSGAVELARQRAQAMAAAARAALATA